MKNDKQTGQDSDQSTSQKREKHNKVKQVKASIVLAGLLLFFLFSFF